MKEKKIKRRRCVYNLLILSNVRLGSTAPVTHRKKAGRQEDPFYSRTASIRSDFFLSPDFRITLMEVYKSTPPLSLPLSPSLPARARPLHITVDFPIDWRRRRPSPRPRKPTCYAPRREEGESRATATDDADGRGIK